MAEQFQPRAQFPVALYKLDPGNEGYDRGKRYRIDTVDGTCFFFATTDETAEFMRVHGLRHVEESEVKRLRQAMAETREWTPDDEAES